jgi:glycosyltransferase involved in cell wall biosynthesis
VSVIIPVRDDPRLAVCLDALARQTYSQERFEIVVIDNGQLGASAGFVAPYANVSLFHEPAPGAYAARNRGVQHARGEVLAFTDADCVPSPGWLAAGAERLSGSDAPDAVGGEIEVVPRDPARLTAAELYEMVWGFPQESFVVDKHFAATANLFVRREAFEAVGPFNAGMMSAGDVEWGQRAHSMGKTLVFGSSALVRHAARRTIGDLAAKYARTCGGHCQLRRMRGEGHGAALAKLVRKPLLALADRQRIPTATERVRYAGVELLISSVQLIELARLVCGGVPRRR